MPGATTDRLGLWAAVPDCTGIAVRGGRGAPAVLLPALLHGASLGPFDLL